VSGEACWSVSVGGRVVGYASDLTLRDVTLTVQPSGRQRIRAQKRREVVAWASGLAGAGDCYPLTWNPYKDGNHFVIIEAGERVPVSGADTVRFRGRAAEACGVRR
jgi:hypothetical protein